MTYKLHDRKVLEKDVIFHTSQLLKQLKKSQNSEDVTKKIEKISNEAPFLTDSSGLKFKSTLDDLKDDINKKYGLSEDTLNENIEMVKSLIEEELEPRSYKRWKEYCRSYAKRNNTKVKKIEIEVSLLENLVDFMSQNHEELFRKKKFKAEKIGKSELKELILILLMDAQEVTEEFPTSL